MPINRYFSLTQLIATASTVINLSVPVTVICKDLTNNRSESRDQGGCGGCIPPPSDFKKFLGRYNFFIISNLFDYNNSYALSTHNRKCANKCVIFGEALRIRGKKFKQNLPENCSKSTKMAIVVCKFSKFFWESIPPVLPGAVFLFLNFLQINSAGKNYA